MNERVYCLIIEQVPTNTFKARKEHPIWNRNHTHEAIHFGKSQILNGEARVQVCFCTRVLPVYECFESRRVPLASHVRWVRNHSVVLPSQQPSLLQERFDDMSRGVRQVAILQHVIKAFINLWQV